MAAGVELTISIYVPHNVLYQNVSYKSKKCAYKYNMYNNVKVEVYANLFSIFSVQIWHTGTYRYCPCIIGNEFYDKRDVISTSQSAINGNFFYRYFKFILVNEELLERKVAALV
jgi:hypothetical protein